MPIRWVYWMKGLMATAQGRRPSTYAQGLPVGLRTPMMRFRMALFCLLLFSGPLPSESTSRIKLPARVFASDWREWGFKVLPDANAHRGVGVLFRLSANGHELIRWSRPLVNLPARVFVYRYQRHNGPTVAVVTVDNFAFLNTTHWLVIYGPTGAVVKDYALDKLLTPREFARFQPLRSSGTTGKYEWWDHASFRVSLNRKLLPKAPVENRGAISRLVEGERQIDRDRAWYQDSEKQVLQQQHRNASLRPRRYGYCFRLDVRDDGFNRDFGLPRTPNIAANAPPGSRRPRNGA